MILAPPLLLSLSLKRFAALSFFPCWDYLPPGVCGYPPPSPAPNRRVWSCPFPRGVLALPLTCGFAVHPDCGSDLSLPSHFGVCFVSPSSLCSFFVAVWACVLFSLHLFSLLCSSLLFVFFSLFVSSLLSPLFYFLIFSLPPLFLSSLPFPLHLSFSLSLPLPLPLPLPFPLPFKAVLVQSL